jgi:hypothetical protein
MNPTNTRSLLLLSCLVSLATAVAVVVGARTVPGLLTPSSARQLELERLILRSPDGQIVAEIRSTERKSGGTTELVFFSNAQKEAMTIGVERGSSGRFVRFFDENGALVGAWNHVGPIGEGTIYLGDADKTGRVQLGALNDESPDTRTLPWGVLVSPGPPSIGRVGIYSTKRSDMPDWLGGIHIRNRGGRDQTLRK